MDGTETTFDLAEQTKARIAAIAPEGLCLAFDDSGTGEGGLVSSLQEVSDLLRPFVRQVLCTSRSLTQQDLLVVHDATIVDKGDLAFDPLEASQLADLFGVKDSSTGCLVTGMVDIAQGHVALLSMMLATIETRNQGRTAEPAIASISMLEQLIRAHLDEADRHVLECAALLGECTAQELERVLGGDAHSRLVRVRSVLPLVALEHRSSGEALFVVHDLVRECLLHSLKTDEERVRAMPLASILSIHAERKDWGTAAMLAKDLLSEEERAALVEKFGRRLLDDSAHSDLVGLISTIGLPKVMGSPRLLLYWAEALHETGHIEESLAKAGAALTVAEHAMDYECAGLALAQRMNTLMDQGKSREAVESAERRKSLLHGRMPAEVRCVVLLAYAAALAGAEREADALDALNGAAEEAAKGKTDSGVVIRQVRRYRVLLEALWTGCWAEAATKLGPILTESQQEPYLVRQTLKGNLAIALVEMGRLTRASELLASVVHRDHTLLDAAYLPALGLVAAARGDSHAALEFIVAGRRAAVDCSDEADVLVNLLHQSAVERSAGRPEQAVESAERSFEGLSERDFFQYSNLAAVEIAASLLCLGGIREARDWATSAQPRTADRNRYTALCAAMVLSVCDAREGNPSAGAERLRSFSEYVATESANWRIAMYCRSFPELLGLMTLAIGASELPVHMLRMVLPENVERSLRAGKGLLPAAEWEELGKRSLGQEQFAAFLERKGRPICHVRLFGGLDVSVDGRAIRERDWKKRKARLLFAMLVARRGHDVARDQILEYLWPDLDDERAKNNFYVAWSTMKSALAGPGRGQSRALYVESNQGRCRIVRDAVRADVDDFEEALTRMRDGETKEDSAAAIAAANDLMSVYRGELLPGDLYDDWFSPLRDKYRIEFVDAMLRASEILLAQDDPCEALVFARRGLDADPYREDLYQCALRCHIAAGQRSGAIDTFIQCKTQLAEQLGLDPAPETMELYQQVIAMENRPRRDTYGLP